MSVILQRRTAPAALNVPEALAEVDKEMAEIIDYLTVEETIEPGDIIDNCDRLAYLARSRESLVNVVKYHSEYTSPVRQNLSDSLNSHRKSMQYFL